MLSELLVFFKSQVAVDEGRGCGVAVIGFLKNVEGGWINVNVLKIEERMRELVVRAIVIKDFVYK